MDKKRRIYNALKKTNSQKEWLAAMTSVSTYKLCGTIYKKFQFLDNFGKGFFEYHLFDGLYLGITDVQLTSNFKVSAHNDVDIIELSFLIEGEQIINVSGIKNNFIYESLQSYLVNISELKTCVTYHKNKRLKEVKIRINTSFIKRHRIDEAYNLLENYSLHKLKGDFSKPLCVKTQEILSEILSDSRTGLLKRLFLESKTLELIALQLDVTKNSDRNRLHKADNLLNKLYKIQHLITSNLTIQYSIQELAREIGVNDFVLKKEFKRVFNQTIFEYANETRMKKAKQLLLHTNKPIYEISEMIGYKNATHFSAAFKKQEELTPKKYRLKAKQHH